MSLTGRESVAVGASYVAERNPNWTRDELILALDLWARA
jgi:hypothetical protein